MYSRNSEYNLEYQFCPLKYYSNIANGLYARSSLRQWKSKAIYLETAELTHAKDTAGNHVNTAA